MGFLSDRRERKEQERAAEEAFTQAASRIASGEPGQAIAAARSLATANLSNVPASVRDRVGGQALRSYAEVALADDRLSEAEGEELLEIADALGIDNAALGTRYSDLLARLAIAQVNDGRLGEIENPERIVVKRGEVVHLQTEAALMKEAAIREWQGGSAGFSFRVAKGVSFRTGNVRGKSVVVGTEMRTEDVGVLSVTSARLSYLGNRKTVDIPYAKLVGLDVFADGLSVQSSSRQLAVLLQTKNGYGEVVAATINAAMQELL